MSSSHGRSSATPRARPAAGATGIPSVAPGFGFGLTGDTALLDLGKANLARLLAQVYVGEDPAFRGTGGYWTCGDHPYSIRSLPVLLGAMASAPISWRRENLPLLQTNRTAHFAGPRLPDLVVVPDGTGDPITLALRLGLKQAVRLGDRTIERPSDSLVLLGEPDLGPGETRFTFPLRPTRHEGDYIDRGNADLVVARGLKIAILPSTEEGHFCLFGPRFYFFVPPEVQRVQVEVQTAETWAVYGWKPIVHLFDPDGKAVDTGEGPGAFELEAEAGPSQRGTLWSLGPLGRVSAPRENATWNKPMRDPAAHFPAFFRLPRDVPKIVSPHPDLFFLPSDRGGPASHSGATLP